MNVLPTLEVAARASMQDILGLWIGLGYNRRARFLYETIRTANSMSLEDIETNLLSFPGIGKNTEGAIKAYCFDTPTVFVETNIRTVFIHHFFAERDKVSDSEIIDLVDQTLPTSNVREWYWALMDYGTHLKTKFSLNNRSLHYKKQSRFNGSTRQIRGAILRRLQQCAQSTASLLLLFPDTDIKPILDTLSNDKLIYLRGNIWHLGSNDLGN